MSLTSQSKVTIPQRLELEYMLDQRRLFRKLEWLTVACIGRVDRRQDSPALEAFLRLSAPQILDEATLRRRLRQLAGTLTQQKLAELRALLGRRVSAPAPGLITQWIDEQVLAIQASVEQWLTTALRLIAEAPTASISETVSGLGVLADSLSKNATDRASFRLLQLNGKIIEEIARGAGSTHYRWITEQDSRVRPNHEVLHSESLGRIYSWAEPPPGGGTRANEPGHPGSGFGCRCIAEPIPGQAPLNAFG